MNRLVRTECWPPYPSQPICPPPGCTCGQDPCQCGCGGLTQCWNDITALKQIIAEVIGDMGGPVNTGPIQGVVDGSLAKPGDVGEFIQTDVITSWSLANNAGSQQIAQFIFQPGDWDVNSFGYCDFNFTVFNIYAGPPQPVGLSNNLGAVAAVSDPAIISTATDITINGPRAQLSCSVPTLIPMSINITNSTGAAVSGHSHCILSARRMR